MRALTSQQVAPGEDGPMKSFLESKAMAKALRQSLAERNVELTHGECLDLVAKQFGLADWNVLSARIAAAEAKRTPLPMAPGWFATGFTDMERYRVGLDRTSPGDALIECIAGCDVDLGSERFACMMQSIDASDYAGMTLRLTANLRCEDADLGTIWMRVDGQDKRSIRFDNMMTRTEDGTIQGTMGWTSRAIVLDIPSDAASIHYGFFLKGHGKVWARSFRIEIAPPDSRTTEAGTAPIETKLLPKQPVNLGLMAG